MIWKQIQRHSILHVLSAGFTLVILLLLIAGFVGLRNIYVIKENAASLVAQEVATTNLIDEIRSERGALDAVFHKITRDPQSIDREKILAELDNTDEHIGRILASVAGKPEEPVWRKLETAITEFSAEARHMLSLDTPPTSLSRDLFHRHDTVLNIIGDLIRSNDQAEIAAQQQIARNSAELVRRSAWLFGACLLLALVCAVLTVRVTAQLFQNMEWQTSELSRVSWHMLENQETTARRFSHELHDELGQSLTAVKANLAAMDDSRGRRSSERLEDCLSLVNEAIGNVRQLSQLLRPTILDDFGLDAALRWLCDRFTQRTRIEVEYTSNFTGRMADETETHLFRISQEALTNVARHSGATSVRVSLQAGEEKVRLSISDNGRGLDGQANAAGMGMIGMRARARSMGGEVALQTSPGTGLSIEVDLPLKNVQDGQENPHLVGR